MNDEEEFDLKEVDVEEVVLEAEAEMEEVNVEEEVDMLTAFRAELQMRPAAPDRLESKCALHPAP